MTIAKILRDKFNPVRVLSPKIAYQLWAPTYDECSDNAVLYLEEQSVLPLLDEVLIRGKLVIDFGCGTGRHIRHFLDKSARQVIGLDFSRHMLSVANGKLDSSEVLLVQSDLMEIPFTDSQFDFGIASLVLSHIKDLMSALREVSRVMKPGSRLLIADLHWTFERRGWKRTFVAKHLKAVRIAVEHVTHELGEYHEVFEQCGLKVEEFFEPVLGSSLFPLFARANMIKTFEQYENQPLLVVFQLLKI